MPVDNETPHAGLTPREREVARLVVRSMKAREIADELGIRPGTAQSHVASLHTKTYTHSMVELALWIVEHFRCCIAEPG